MSPRINVVDTLIGRFLLLSGPDYISNTLFRAGDWEPVTRKAAELLLGLDPDPGTIIDVGANVGAFTIPMARAGHKLVSFEVQRFVFQQLCGAAALNGLLNVTAHNVGLGAAPGWLDIPVPNYGLDRNIGGLSIDPEVRKLRGPQQGTPTDMTPPTERVQVLPLDHFKIEKVKLVKLDVEGMELDVLEGGAETLEASHFPPLLFELWDTKALPAFSERQGRLLDHVKSLGYAMQRLGELVIAQHTSRSTRVDFRAENGQVRARVLSSNDAAISSPAPG